MVETKKKRQKKKELFSADEPVESATEIEEPLPRPPEQFDGLASLAAFAEISDNPFDIEKEQGPIKKIRMANIKATTLSTETTEKQHTRLLVETVRNSSPFQLKLQMNIDSIPKEIPREFIQKNQPFSKPKTHLEIKGNSIAWKLAYLNPELDGNLELLQRCVDVYMERFEEGFKPRQGKILMNRVFHKLKIE